MVFLECYKTGELNEIYYFKTGGKRVFFRVNPAWISVSLLLQREQSTENNIFPWGLNTIFHYNKVHTQLNNNK